MSEQWRQFSTVYRGEAGYKIVQYDNVPNGVSAYDVSVQSLADVPYPSCRTIEFFRTESGQQCARVKIY